MQISATVEYLQGGFSLKLRDMSIYYLYVASLHETVSPMMRVEVRDEDIPERKCLSCTSGNYRQLS